MPSPTPREKSINLFYSQILENMMITIILLLLLLDIQRPPIPETVDNRFVVTELVEESLTGCAPSYQSGGAQNQMITVDWVGNDDPHERTTATARLTGPGFGDETLVTPMVMPYDPPGLPDPDPTTPPPVAVVPEPPTAAILGISTVALLYLLFGRKRQKLSRRS